MFLRARTVRLFGSAFLAALAAGASPAFAVEDFYKGRSINVLVGFTTGNGADSYARLIARWFGKYVPGAPNVVVQNMPGSGSLTMTNNLYNVAPKDGSTFGIFNRNVPLEPLMGNTNARFDPRKFTWLGSTNTEPSLCVAWHRSPVKSIADVQAREFTVAATGLNANSGLVPTVLNRVMGAKFKIIMGYPGSNEMSLAMERGEVEGRCGWSRSSLMATKPQWVSDKQINLLLQAGLQKSPLMPEVPLAMDSVKDEADRQLLKLAVAWDEMAWPFAAPPDIPADRATALRAAFASVLKDPELVTQAGREGLDLNYVSPAQISRILDDVFATPEPIIATLKGIVRTK
jgi:tripartite-type tricarboxylate transporter receptor subunit TctC